MQLGQFDKFKVDKSDGETDRKLGVVVGEIDGRGISYCFMFYDWIMSSFSPHFRPSSAIVILYQGIWLTF